MRVFTCTDHGGYYPVGVASVIVAETPEMALDMMKAEIERCRGLEWTGNETVEEINLFRPFVHVLCDGNY